MLTFDFPVLETDERAIVTPIENVSLPELLDAISLG
jgi:hypothetical protein